MATYLEFEEKIRKIEEEIVIARTKADEPAIEILEKKLEKEVEKTFKNLNDYQKLQLARHPDRPYALDYINGLLTDAYEVHGDRHYVDDHAIVCYFGFIDNQKVLIIGEQKGRGTKEKLKRNFGMPSPEGYRKALRAALMAEKFQVPILMLVDTPGAYPGLGAEERNQSEAIAKNLFEFANLTTPTVSVVIGEGGSGGALAISVADKLAMMRYSVYAVISPEGCSAILWNDPSKVETAAQALRITSDNLKQQNLIDDVVNEPLIGAHRKKDEAIMALKEYFLSSVEELKKLSPKERQERKYQKIMNLGSFEE
ncbi:acetyl-CoA carboxylase carboxyl transferase subunit alpha [Aliarcobacter skirrowii]|uniref:Acetyl-coenzyme A carboxylase carboxyl transferase subunit alpha n=1 Tax=Aliarcobacter skirrowii CCUG 10374 TaxID=1032239 RepID=A0AAD0WN48_9BACT|nr:acetyl-CoA carboxylase carboxyl transferase subunit alpha [Aliarcobacter skirrowii]AXX84115.1 acetyl-CoA carboxylase, carboxyltransferase, alpha subunit [Aliarcobacter skirrowii CCUG 10374]KAB0621698.1 acetyl-CoA carboxylase carboxyl transferase subunit alpha [Aliarcobacter skirrowii CCUG 10374]RXI26951.1 acetyl-CoA carboxylase carboxyltransferase subunit alpha [Aliarcobacter skirrowii CCUG 10374]SUV14271.1 Acetyl-coenzyme A carboxylase carboxyl transferase subunit alpha [Aliarcobacter skirr